MIESPCVKICTLDARKALFLGCGRTLDEIARWAAMSGPERKRVMGELQTRLVAYDAASLAATSGVMP